MEMQPVVARVTAVVAVVSEAMARTTLEAAKQSAEDRTTAAQSTATTATTEQDALVMRLALDEAEIEKLRAAAAFPNEATKRATAAAAAAEARPWLRRSRRSSRRWRIWSATWPPTEWTL
jgi:cell division protein FtsB